MYVFSSSFKLSIYIWNGLTDRVLYAANDLLRKYKGKDYMVPFDIKN